VYLRLLTDNKPNSPTEINRNYAIKFVMTNQSASCKFRIQQRWCKLR